jgi:hypothetical protein
MKGITGQINRGLQGIVWTMLSGLLVLPCGLQAAPQKPNAHTYPRQSSGYSRMSHCGML